MLASLLRHTADSRIKRPLSIRIANAALAVVYSKAVTYGGPEAASANSASANSVVVRYPAGTALGALAVDTCPTALGVPDTLCGGFALAGSDGQSYAATAALGTDGASLRITASGMPASVVPAFAQYAQAVWPQVAIYDTAGLPGLPFNLPVSASPAPTPAAPSISSSPTRSPSPSATYVPPSQSASHSAASTPSPTYVPSSPSSSFLPALDLFVDCNRAKRMADVAARPPDGTMASPYWSPNGARDAVRALPRPLIRRVFVNVLPGDCLPRDSVTGALDFTQAVLSLEPRDSGSPGYPVTYRAYGAGGSARLLEGLPLNASLWRAQSSAAPSPAAAGAYAAGTALNVMVIDLLAAAAAAGGSAATLSAVGLGAITLPGTAMGCPSQTVAELFYAGKPMTLSRYPNTRPDRTGGFMFVSGIAYDSSGRTVLRTANSRPARRWAAETDAWLHGYWQ